MRGIDCELLIHSALKESGKIWEEMGFGGMKGLNCNGLSFFYGVNQVEPNLPVILH